MGFLYKIHSELYEEICWWSFAKVRLKKLLYNFVYDNGILLLLAVAVNQLKSTGKTLMYEYTDPLFIYWTCFQLAVCCINAGQSE